MKNVQSARRPFAFVIPIAITAFSGAIGCHGHDAGSNADAGASIDGALAASPPSSSSSAKPADVAPPSSASAAPASPALSFLPLLDAGPLPPNLGLGADGVVKPGFRKPKLEAADVATIFAKVPQLARFSQDVHLYDAGDVNSIRTRSSAATEGVTFTTQPLLWVPETETELLVVLAHTKSTGMVIALYPLPNNEYRLASSFLLQNDLSPLALAFDPHNRKELIWTTCWGCAGGQGHVSVRDDHRVVIVQD